MFKENEIVLHTSVNILYMSIATALHWDTDEISRIKNEYVKHVVAQKAQRR